MFPIHFPRFITLIAQGFTKTISDLSIGNASLSLNNIALPVRQVVLEPLEHRQLLAGVTLITHGYQPVSSERPQWLDLMATAIQAQVGQSLPIYGLRIASNLSASVERLNTSGPTGLSDQTATSGEAIVLLDWASASGVVWNYHLTTAIASIAANFLVSTYPNVGIDKPLANLPLHVMGHSRGGSVVSELSRLLGEQGIIVEHQTTWDPRPVFADPETRVYQRTIFADNYYQTDNTNVTEGFITGSSVQGAHNVLLNGMSIGHAGVYTYYANTIGAASGFGWSRIGKQPVPDDGFILAGAYRTPLTVTATGSGAWDNALLFPSNDAVTRGKRLTVPLIIDDANQDSTVWVGVDTDSNPYNGATWTFSKSASEFLAAGLQPSLETANLAAGRYYLCAAIGNGTNIRYDYSLETVSVVEPRPKLPSFAAIFGRTLVVTGTVSSDVIGVSRKNQVITAALNGQVMTFEKSRVDVIAIKGAAGNDKITVGAGVWSTFIEGGDGKDYIIGGVGPDMIYGNAQPDYIDGGAGDDKLVGSGGNDIITGRDGNDRIYGNAGNDTMYGGNGNDRMYGGAGNDSLYGGTGRDILYGEAGSDVLVGGPHSDWCDDDKADKRIAIEIIM